MRELSKLYLEKKTTKSGKEVFYIKERSRESLDSVVICMCLSGAIARRVLKALREENKGDQAKPRKSVQSVEQKKTQGQTANTQN